MIKFQRNYKLTIQVSPNDVIIVEPPTTIEFSIIRSTLASFNTASIKIYGLSKEHRSAIFQDLWNLRDYRAIALQAGYSSVNLPLVFAGNIMFSGWE